MLVKKERFPILMTSPCHHPLDHSISACVRDSVYYLYCYSCLCRIAGVETSSEELEASSGVVLSYMCFAP